MQMGYFLSTASRSEIRVPCARQLSLDRSGPSAGPGRNLRPPLQQRQPGYSSVADELMKLGRDYWEVRICVVLWNMYA